MGVLWEACAATVWEAASDLLQMSPTTFAAMGELEQFRHVQAVSSVLCAFRVTKGVLTLQELQITTSSSILPVCTKWCSTFSPARPRLGLQSFPRSPAQPAARGRSPTRIPKMQPPRYSSPPWSTPAEDFKSPATSSTAASDVDSVGASGLEEEGDGTDDNSMASVMNRLASSLSSSLDIYSGSN
ncbi:unnamed protein product [Calypogeia fissa]